MFKTTCHCYHHHTSLNLILIIRAAIIYCTLISFSRDPSHPYYISVWNLSLTRHDRHNIYLNPSPVLNKTYDVFQPSGRHHPRKKVPISLNSTSKVIGSQIHPMYPKSRLPSQPSLEQLPKSSDVIIERSCLIYFHTIGTSWNFWRTTTTTLLWKLTRI